MLWLAVLLGLGAAAIFAVGAVAQQQEASSVTGSGLSFVRNLLRSPRWWAATFADGLGYCMQAAGLAVGSILVVQPLLIASLVFALPLSARWNARPIRGRDLGWAVAIALALATFLIVGNPDGGVDNARFSRWVPSILGCGIVVLIGTTLALGRSTRRRSLGLAMIAGTLFGFASALTKSVMNLIGDGGGALATSWETYALVGVGVIGLTCQQLAFQAGSLEISFPAATVLDPVVSVAVGIAALDEGVRTSGLGWVLIALSATVMVLGTLALARAGVPTMPADAAEPQATSVSAGAPTSAGAAAVLPTGVGTNKARPNGSTRNPSAPA